MGSCFSVFRSRDSPPSQPEFGVGHVRTQRCKPQYALQLQPCFTHTQIPPWRPQRRWLCDAMIFNHYPPTCVNCQDCGGPSRCGMGCSALVSNKIAGYPVCTTIGHTSSMVIDLIDKKDPHAGVVVKMYNSDRKLNCSLAVSVICDSSRVQGPRTLEKVGTCNYAVALRHPSGCANIVPVHGKGLGWFGTFITVILCLFGGYLLSGIGYRFFYLGVRGIDVVPNLEIWASLPHRAQSMYTTLVRKFRGPSQSYRSSYSPVNF